MERACRFDNIKYLMIFLVVFGHFIEPLIHQSAIFKTIWMAIYSFHMPVFVFISGMFSKADLDGNNLRKNIRNILIPCLVFTILYELFNFIMEGNISVYTKNLQPYWILWFLYSLFIWRLLLPLVLSFRFPVVISVSVAVFSGYFESINYFLGLSRTLYFLPFFVIGHKIASVVLFYDKKAPITELVLWTVLVFNFLFFALFNSDIPYKWLYGSYSFTDLGVYGWQAGGYRLIFIFLSLSTVVSIVLLMSEKKLWFTKKGERSIYVYLWHGFVIKIFMILGLNEIMTEISQLFALFILLFLSFIVTAMFSNKKFVKYTDIYLFEPARRFFLIR